MKYVKFIIAIFLMLVVVVLVVENHEPMSTRVAFKVNFLTLHLTSPEMSLYHIVTIAFLFGVLVTGLYGMIERFRLKRQLKIITKHAQDKDRELNSLRNLPITSDDVSPDQTSET